MSEKIHLIDFGNSNDGPFGMVVRAKAKGPKSAVKRAAELLNRDMSSCPRISDVSADGITVGMTVWEDKETEESIRIYVTPMNISRDELTYGDLEADYEEE
jgi:hypothetical protein